MKFCPLCESRMNKTTATGSIQFVCRCQETIPGAPEDTLMSEELSQSSNAKYEVFIDNAPFDLASNKVLMPCPNCSLPFLNMIRVGINEQVLYVCRCGFKITHEEYKKLNSG